MTNEVNPETLLSQLNVAEGMIRYLRNHAAILDQQLRASNKVIEDQAKELEKHQNTSN